MKSNIIVLSLVGVSLGFGGKYLYTESKKIKEIYEIKNELAIDAINAYQITQFKEKTPTNPDKKVITKYYDFTLQSGLRDEIDAISECLYFEARGEGIIGMLAVAQVLWNRKNNSHDFGDTYREVIEQRIDGYPQFEYQNKSKYINKKSITYVIAQEIAMLMVQNRLDYLKEIRDFGMNYTEAEKVLKSVRNAFFFSTRKIAYESNNKLFRPLCNGHKRNQAKCVTIGNHTFVTAVKGSEFERRIHLKHNIQLANGI